MSKDGRIKTTYCFAEACVEPHVQVLEIKTGKSFYIIYQSNYFLYKAIMRIKRGRTFKIISHNHRPY